MITGIRSAVFCDKVEKDERGPSYIGLHGDVLTADSRPGLIKASIALSLDVDGQASLGNVLLSAEGFSESFPFSVPVGCSVATLVLPVVIVVLKVGLLGVAVHNAPGAVLRQTWTLAFCDDAKVLSDDADEKFIRAAADAAELVRGSAQVIH
jgi:hypothetical protein